MADQSGPLDWIRFLKNARIEFWACPDGHSERDPDAPPRTTVEWRDDVAYCRTPGCRQTSRGPEGEFRG